MFVEYKSLKIDIPGGWGVPNGLGYSRSDGFVKSPSAALRFTPQFLRTWHVGASCTRPIMGVRPDAPTIETIILLNFKRDHQEVKTF